MSRILRFHPAVAGDIAAAVVWYRTNRPGLDVDFQRELDATIAAIESNPLQYQMVDRGLRRAMLHGFPYAVMYTVSDEQLLIVGCRHTRRSPADWRRRLE